MKTPRVALALFDDFRSFVAVAATVPPDTVPALLSFLDDNQELIGTVIGNAVGGAIQAQARSVPATWQVRVANNPLEIGTIFEWVASEDLIARASRQWPPGGEEKFIGEVFDVDALDGSAPRATTTRPTFGALLEALVAAVSTAQADVDAEAEAAAAEEEPRREAPQSAEDLAYETRTRRDLVAVMDRTKRSVSNYLLRNGFWGYAPAEKTWGARVGPLTWDFTWEAGGGEAFTTTIRYDEGADEWEHRGTVFTEAFQGTRISLTDWPVAGLQSDQIIEAHVHFPSGTLGRIPRRGGASEGAWGAFTPTARFPDKLDAMAPHVRRLLAFFEKAGLLRWLRASSPSDELTVQGSSDAMMPLVFRWAWVSPLEIKRMSGSYPKPGDVPPRALFFGHHTADASQTIDTSAVVFIHDSGHCVSRMTSHAWGRPGGDDALYRMWITNLADQGWAGRISAAVDDALRKMRPTDTELPPAAEVEPPTGAVEGWSAFETEGFRKFSRPLPGNTRIDPSLGFSYRIEDRSTRKAPAFEAVAISNADKKLFWISTRGTATDSSGSTSDSTVHPSARAAATAVYAHQAKLGGVADSPVSPGTPNDSGAVEGRAFRALTWDDRDPSTSMVIARAAFGGHQYTVAWPMQHTAGRGGETGAGMVDRSRGMHVSVAMGGDRNWSGIGYLDAQGTLIHGDPYRFSDVEAAKRAAERHAAGAVSPATEADAIAHTTDVVRGYEAMSDYPWLQRMTFRAEPLNPTRDTERRVLAQYGNLPVYVVTVEYPDDLPTGLRDALVDKSEPGNMKILYEFEIRRAAPAPPPPSSTPPTPDPEVRLPHFEVRAGRVFADTNALNVAGKIPGVSVDHIGFGDFRTATPHGNVEWIRMDSSAGTHDIPGQVGRPHELSGPQAAIDFLVAGWREMRRAAVPVEAGADVRPAAQPEPGRTTFPAIERFFDLRKLDGNQMAKLREVFVHGLVVVGDDRLLDAWTDARTDAEPDPMNRVSSVPNPARMGTRDTLLITVGENWRGTEHEAAWAGARGAGADPNELPPVTVPGVALSVRRPYEPPSELSTGSVPTFNVNRDGQPIGYIVPPLGDANWSAFGLAAKPPHPMIGDYPSAQAATEAVANARPPGPTVTSGRFVPAESWRDTVNAALAAYDATLAEDGAIVKSGKRLGVKAVPTRGGIRWESQTGRVLTTGPATAAAVDDFVAKFWYWSKVPSTPTQATSDPRAALRVGDQIRITRGLNVGEVATVTDVGEPIVVAPIYGGDSETKIPVRIRFGNGQERALGSTETFEVAGRPATDPRLTDYGDFQFTGTADAPEWVRDDPGHRVWVEPFGPEAPDYWNAYHTDTTKAYPVRGKFESGTLDEVLHRVGAWMNQQSAQAQAPKAKPTDADMMSAFKALLRDALK